MERLAIGKIGKTHGVNGFVRVVSFSGEIDHFFNLSEVEVVTTLGEKIFEIEKIEDYKAGVILIKFKGVDSPEAGKGLANCEIRVSRELCAPLMEGEYYYADLCKCSLVKDNRVIGKVRGVSEAGSSDLLEIVDTRGKTFYVPFISRFIGDVNMKEKTIELIADWLI